MSEETYCLLDLNEESDEIYEVINNRKARLVPVDSHLHKHLPGMVYLSNE